MNKLDRGLLVTIVVALLATICLLSVDIVKHNLMERELAAARSAVTSDHDLRGNKADSAIREVKGHYFAEDTILTEDGNMWSVNTDGIMDCELLLVWFDTMGTDSVEDDQIIEIWRTVYD